LEASEDHFSGTYEDDFGDGAGAVGSTNSDLVVGVYLTRLKND
jgi:hypothetical protein